MIERRILQMLALFVPGLWAAGIDLDGLRGPLDFRSARTNVKELQAVTARALKKGAYVFREGEAPDGRMYFIAQGTLVVSKMKGAAARFLRRMEQGQFFGEMGLVNNIPRTATIQVESESAKLVVIDRLTFVRLAKTHPLFLHRLLITVYARVAVAEKGLNAFYDTAERSVTFNVMEYVNNMYLRSFSRGDYVFDEGSVSDGMIYVVLSGNLSVMRTASDGLKVETGVIAEGTVFGEDGVLGFDRRSFGTRVKSEYARIGGLDKEAFLRVGSIKPELLFMLLRLCIDRLVQVEAKIAQQPR